MALTTQPNLACPGDSSQPRKIVRWRIVTERHGRHYLHYLETDENLAGSALMRLIVGLCDAEAALPTFVNWMRHPVIETAIIEGTPDPEAQEPQRVALTSHTINNGLTKCCRDPTGFVSLDAFATLHPEFVANNSGEPKAMLVRHELTHAGMALVISLALLIVVLISLLVGFLTGHASFGISIAGVVAALAVFAKLGSWMRKR
ncbi:hypothetical protein F5Y10DRAFT_19785 [Nemania abortiva]|nr:hypothetical protein F5Y10DRAFT_19785 [Nemania abortiva]